MSNTKQEHAAERRRREVSAPRLSKMIPALTSLRLDMREYTATSSTRYRKHVIVASAPAVFLVTCGDERCDEGGHDITVAVLAALHARAPRSSGEHTCHGSVGTAPCGRRIEYELFAEYQAQAAKLDTTQA